MVPLAPLGPTHTCNGQQDPSAILVIKHLSTTLAFIKVLSLRRRKIKEDGKISRSTKGTRTRVSVSSRMSLGSLPNDVLLELFLWLSLQEIKSLRLTCRALFRASEARPVWAGAVYDFQAQCRDLVIDPLADLKSLSLASAKQLALRTDFLERNWGNRLLPARKSGRTTTPPRSFRLASDILDPTPYSSALVTSRLMFLPKSESILCLDIERNVLVASFPIGLKNARTAFDHNASLGTIYAAVAGIADGQDLQLQILEVSLPKENRTTNPECSFNPVSIYNLPRTWAILSKIIDPVHKDVCLLVIPIPQPQTLKIFYISSWDTEPSMCCLIDTDVHFVFPLAQSTTSLRFTRDYANVVLCAERDELWIQKTYSVKELRSLATSMPFTNHPDNMAQAHPWCCTTEFRMPKVPGILDMDLKLLWAWPGTWGFYTSPHIEFSDIAVYEMNAGAGVGVGKTRWRIAQHYTSSSGPHSATRSVIDLEDPPLVYSAVGDKRVPIISVSFNHVAWIDHRDVVRSLRRRTVRSRVMRLAAFPDHQRPNSECSILSLPDIPSDVLDRTYRVFLEPCTARIMVATTDNDLYTYHYA